MRSTPSPVTAAMIGVTACQGRAKDFFFSIVTSQYLCRLVGACHVFLCTARISLAEHVKIVPCPPLEVRTTNGQWYGGLFFAAEDLGGGEVR